MGTETTPTTETPTTETPPATPPTPPAQAAPPAATPPAQAAPPAAPAATGASKEPSAKKVKVGEEEEIPEDAELIEMPRKALSKRLAQHTSSELKKRFGTSDMGEIEGKLKKLAEVEAREEEQRRATLSETEKLKEDVAAKEREAAEWKSKYEYEQEVKAFKTENDRATTLAAKYVKPKYAAYATTAFAAHLRGLDGKEQDAFAEDESKIEAWFRDSYAKEHPEIALSAVVEEKKPPEKKPLTTGLSPKDKPAARTAPGEAAGKTAKPGQANSMTKAEYQAHLRSKGLGY